MQPNEVLVLVTEALESLGIAYCIGGSFASSTYGEPRATRDIDILLTLTLAQAQRIVTHVTSDFFVQLADLADAIALAPTLADDPMHRATCNLVHRSSFFRVDLFVSSGRPFEVAQLARRIPQIIGLSPERQAFFSSPEDVILNKLEWYRMAQGMLDRQWSDVQAVIATQRQHLDHAYLRHWAPQLDVADLLEAALRGASPPALHAPDDDTQQLCLDI